MILCQACLIKLISAVSGVHHHWCGRIAWRRSIVYFMTVHSRHMLITFLVSLQVTAQKSMRMYVLVVIKFLLCTDLNACMPKNMLLMPEGLPKKWCSLKAWLWASSTVCSRTMHVPYSSAGALTPFGDLHNYHSPPPPHYPEIGELCCSGRIVCSLGRS